jgi:hypothetical protein
MRFGLQIVYANVVCGRIRVCLLVCPALTNHTVPNHFSRETVGFVSSWLQSGWGPFLHDSI